MWKYPTHPLRKDSNVKRAAKALVALGLTAITIAPSFAATQEGAVKATWNVAATASLTLATNYVTTTGLQGTATQSVQPSVAGTCAAVGSETALNLSYGQLTPSATVAVGCNYQRAVLASVITNDSLGYKVEEYEEALPTTGITFCAFPNGSTATGAGPASSQSSAPAAYSGACASGGTALIAGTAGAPNNGAGQPGTNPANATAPASPYDWVSATAATAGTNYGQDLQINLAANQASSASDFTYIIIELIPN
jgi:hypothetical protein